MRKKVNDDEFREIISLIISGEKVDAIVKAYGYSNGSPIYKMYRKFQAMVTDYANCHTKDETIEKYKDYGVNSDWLEKMEFKFASAEENIESEPDEQPLNENAIKRNYSYGISVEEIAEIYGIDENTVKNIVGLPEEKNTRKRPPLHTGDLVWVRNSKDPVDRTGKPRLAVVLSPNNIITDNNDQIVVVYGSTREKNNEYSFFINKWYSGKEVWFDMNAISLIHKSSIVIPPVGESHTGLNETDFKNLKIRLARFFGLWYNEERNDDDTAEIKADASQIIVDLFTNGLDRNTIYELLKQTVYTVSKAEIQSILDKSGFSGIKKLSTDPQPETEVEAEAEIETTSESKPEINLELEKENLVLKAKLEIYEKIFNAENVHITI